MNRFIRYGIIAFVVLLVVLCALVARPCGYARIVLVKYGDDVEVEVFDDRQNLLLAERLDGFAPVRKRVFIEGEISYRIRAVNLKTGNVMEGSGNYDFPHNCQTNMFLIDDEGIHKASWMADGSFRMLFMLAGDELSCLDARVYNAMRHDG